MNAKAGVLALQKVEEVITETLHLDGTLLLWDLTFAAVTDRLLGQPGPSKLQGAGHRAHKPHSGRPHRLGGFYNLHLVMSSLSTWTIWS